MKNQKTTTAAFIAAIISFAFLFTAVPLADSADAVSTGDITQLDFKLAPVSISYADELPAAAAGGAVIIVDGVVYQWLYAATWYYPDAVAIAPSDQFIIDKTMLHWFKWVPMLPTSTVLENANIKSFFTIAPSATEWQFISDGPPLLSTVAPGDGWDASTVVVGTPPAAGPIGIGHITDMYAAPGSPTIDVEIIAWAVETIATDGWVVVGELPSSGGAGTTTNNIPWEYILAALVVGIIVGVVARSYGDD